MTALAVTALVAANAHPAYTLVAGFINDLIVNSQSYKERYGHWDVIELPPQQRVNAIHAAVLPTGKVLIIAGSGNDITQFEAGTFKTLVYDPASGATTFVPTPTDLFCAGHTYLANGNLLVAGGTLRYEILEDAVTRASGLMTVKNEDPDGAPRTFAKGTEFIAPDGAVYLATSEFTVAPATKTIIDRFNNVTVTASTTTVWVEAAVEGEAGVRQTRAQYRVGGLQGVDAQNIYGLNESMTLAKQDFQGRREAYEFNPLTERYERVGDMQEPRWYPTLIGLTDGRVAAVSGLDGAGQVVPGITEIYDPATRSWTTHPELEQYFPTYPAIFQTQHKDVLFYTGSNAGYGPADKGRQPGFWDLSTNTFTPVPGLRDPEIMETSGSAWVGPVQNQRLMVVGGGGVGDSPLSTARIDIIDLSAPQPRFLPGPSLKAGTRYPIVVQLPDDTTLITGGSSGYRGRGRSDLYYAYLYHPDTNTLSDVASPNVGRDYHSAGLLLPDGRVIVLGSNPLFSDEDDLIPAPFEQRIEIYTPAYLYRPDPRPEILDAPATAALGDTVSVRTSDPSRIASARLIRPGVSTHVTDVDQRVVALEFTRSDQGIDVTVPENPGIVLPGFYMLFLISDAGVPSVASWVHITP